MGPPAWGGVSRFCPSRTPGHGGGHDVVSRPVRWFQTAGRTTRPTTPRSETRAFLMDPRCGAPANSILRLPGGVVGRGRTPRPVAGGLVGRNRPGGSRPGLTVETAPRGGRRSSSWLPLSTPCQGSTARAASLPPITIAVRRDGGGGVYNERRRVGWFEPGRVQPCHQWASRGDRYARLPDRVSRRTARTPVRGAPTFRNRGGPPTYPPSRPTTM